MRAKAHCRKINVPIRYKHFGHKYKCISCFINCLNEKKIVSQKIMKGQMYLKYTWTWEGGNSESNITIFLSIKCIWTNAVLYNDFTSELKCIMCLASRMSSFLTNQWFNLAYIPISSVVCRDSLLYFYNHSQTIL